MSKQVIYSCPCLNIRIHLSTKYNLDNLEDIRKENAVQEPLAGWEFDLGMGGIITEYSSFVSTLSIKPEWNTIQCLHCNRGNVYSVLENELPGPTNRVVIHDAAIYGQAYEAKKKKTGYSKTFSIDLDEADIELKEKQIVSMPASEEEVPNNLVSTYKKIRSVLDQSVEQMKIESKVRIEEFKKREEKELQASIRRARLEEDTLWSRMVQPTVVTSKEPAKEQQVLETDIDEIKKKSTNEKDHRVRFAGQEEPSSIKRSGFDLDESAIGILRHIDLDQNKLQNKDEDEDQVEEDEDMFHLDEEFSDEEEREEEKETEKENAEEEEETKDNGLLSASLKKSISEIDQKFSWIKKKRNTNKYLTQDFDIKADLKGSSSRKNYINNEDMPISMFATSVPIAIHYPFDNEVEKQKSNDSSPKKKDILASSFANYDSSFSDRMLSEQFPAPRRRKSVASTSLLVRPQLESLLMGKSLDTRGSLKKKKETPLKNNSNSDDEFDSSLPPHVWAAMKDEEQTE